MELSVSNLLKKMMLKNFHIFSFFFSKNGVTRGLQGGVALFSLDQFGAALVFWAIAPCAGYRSQHDQKKLK